MKTTLELPDDLIRRVNTHAIQHDQQLKDSVAQLLEFGLEELEPRETGGAPKPYRLKHHGPLTIEDIENAIRAGRD